MLRHELGNRGTAGGAVSESMAVHTNLVFTGKSEGQGRIDGSGSKKVLDFAQSASEICKTR